MHSRQRATGLTLFIATSFGAGCNAQGQQLSGTYTVGAPAGPLTVAIEVSAAGAVSGLLSGFSEGEHVLTGSEFEDEITGELTGPGRHGEFEIYLDEDVNHYWFVFAPRSPSGDVLGDAEEEWPMVRGTGPDAMTSLAGIATAIGADEALLLAGGEPLDPAAPVSGPEDEYDPRLVGLWRSQVTMSSPTGGFVQDFFMDFTGDGTMRSWMGRSAASVGGGSIEVDEGDLEEVRWRTVGDRLEVGTGNGVWAPLASIYMEGGSLLLTYYDGHRQLWTRAR